ncbi:cell division FtsA domain-containing protein [Candidatus Gromoviella agglomerans]|uniref:cell division FtsA domain-containing protein n=1 Tax=Candidatus Gromoviella agglomerans TaxID=2806609 RepID=UPI001E395AA2|nr:cell division FtsA domain-containing protein [Candidatus Gromoviella agglomerans]
MFTILDIGNSKTHCIVANINFDSSEILSSIIHKTVGFSNGYVVDMNLFKESMYDIIFKAEQESKSVINEVIIILNGPYISEDQISAKIILKDTPIKQEDLSKILEKSRLSSKDSIIIHSDVMQYQIDDGISINNPVGMIGQELKIRIRNIKSKFTPVQNISICFNDINVAVKDILFGNYILGYSYKTYSENGNFTAIDIGSHLTKISIFENGIMQKHLTLPYGGDFITNEISHSTKIPKSQAERIKIMYGSAINIGAYSDDDNILTTSLENDSIQVSKSRINNIISSQINQMIELIRNEIVPQGDCLILSGGTALLPHITDKFQENIDINVILPNFKQTNKDFSRNRLSKTRFANLNAQNAMIIGAINFLQLKSGMSGVKNNYDNKKNSFIKKILLWVNKRK